MTMSSTAVPRIIPSRPFRRRLAGLVLGGLVMGSTLGTQAVADSGTQHGHIRGHAGDDGRQQRDSRNHSDSRNQRDHRNHGDDRNQSDYRNQRDDRGRSDYRNQSDDRTQRHYPNQRDYRGAGHHSTPLRAHAGPRYFPPAPVRYQAPIRHANPQPYHFRASDRVDLQRHYHSSLRSVRAEHRPYFASGHVIPHAYRSHVAVLPPHLRYGLPPPPRGYQVGYYQGYSVVYDPVTFTILSVLDLLRG